MATDTELIPQLIKAIDGLHVAVDHKAEQLAAGLQSDRENRRRMLIAGLVGLVLAGLAVGAIFRHISDQTRRNQRHTDCSITFALGNDPAACESVKESLSDSKIPLTPNMGAQAADPRTQPAVVLLVCQIAEATGTDPPEGVTCPPPPPPQGES